MTDYAELVERLRRKRQAQPAFGSGSISVNQGGSLIASTSQITDDGMRLVNPDGPEAATAIERLTARLVEEREENLWNAYHVGHVKDGRWTHMFMSDGEWLARQCGFDPRQPDYDDQEIRAAIPKAARLSLGDEK